MKKDEIDSNCDSNIFESKLDVIGNISNAKSTSDYQQTYTKAHQSFDHIGNPSITDNSSVINHISLRVKSKQGTCN